MGDCVFYRVFCPRLYRWRDSVGGGKMRLIDADALKNEMVTDLANTMRMQEMHKGDMAVRVLDKIDEAITIDAVHVVRCENCKHWVESVAATKSVKCCAFAGYMVGENGYCVYGEAKDAD